MEALDPEIPRALARVEAHPADPDAADGVEHVQTHISHVFLTRRRVYKLRKSVDLGFLDFSRRSERNADCGREVDLNRRLAPDVYLGVAPVERVDGVWQVGPLSEAVRDGALEHCVVMRRLPDGGDGLARLAAGSLAAADLDRVAKRMARFHDAHGLGVPAPFTAGEWLARVIQPVTECVEALAGAGLEEVPRERVDALVAACRDRFAGRAGRFEERRRAGLAVDGHGDLHLAHVWFEEEGAEPAIIDCIEFSERLRRIDAASEVAFLAMDLSYRGRADLAARFLAVYAAARDDFGLYGVVDAYQAYRALVRAKVAAIVASEGDVPEAQRADARESALRHLAAAEAFLAEPGRGALVLVAGTVGSGKSTVAGMVSDLLQGAVVSSDRTRKKMAGMEPTARGGSAQGLYSDARSEAVYAGLLLRAVPLVESGRVAVLDATWSRAARRGAALEVAGARGWDAWLLEARCSEEGARARLERRARADDDPSDAGPELLAQSLRDYEPPDEWPGERRIEVDTEAGEWRQELAAALSGLRAG